MRFFPVVLESLGDLWIQPLVPRFRFSALKMDGKPLYEYARENKPLPRPIPSRPCTVSELVLESFTPARQSPNDGGHSYVWPEKHLNAEEKETFRRVNELAKAAGTVKPKLSEEEEEAAMNGEEKVEVMDTLKEVVDEKPDEEFGPPTFTIRMTVSSGTYVRSIVHDIGIAIGSAAHVVTLTRTRQGEFALEDETEKQFDEAAETKKDGDEGDVEETQARKGGCVPWAVWERALAKFKEEQNNEPNEEEAGNDWVPKEWEREVMARFKTV
jgi:tRNA pseudouridine55 synthase